MKPGTGLYEPLEWGLLRTPLLPVRTSADGDTAPELRREPLLCAAVAAASADLAASLDRAPASGRDAARSGNALLRYRIRMRSRPTPFGLFAGVALIGWGGRTDLELVSAAPRTRTRPDMGWLLDLVDTVERDPAVRAELAVRAHPAITRSGGRLIALGADPVVSVRAIPAARRALALARNPVPHAELVQALCAETGAPTGTVEILLDELVRQGLLLTDLRPPLTGGDPSGYVHDRLAGIAAARPVQVALRRFRRACAALDDHPLDGWGAALTEVTSRARAVPSSPRAGDCVQIDSAVDVLGRLHRQVVADAARAAELLLRLGPRPNGPHRLAAYRRAFITRYGHERAVPLLELLDPGRGLGLPPMVDEPASGPDDRDALLGRLAVEAIRDHGNVLHLDDDLVDRLTTWTPDDGPAPSTLDISVLVCASSAAAVDAGEFLAVVGPNLGAGAAGRNLGRFADLLGAPARAALDEAARRAAAAADPAILAEITCRPLRARSANLTVRPNAHAHEIPFDVTPAADPDARIALEDLVVGVDDGRLRLSCARRGRAVVAVQGHMLNAQRTPPVAQFLLDIGTDGTCRYQSFDWGHAAQLPALPRVQAGRIVLAPARWRLDGGQPRALAAGGLDALADWARTWAVPSEVHLSVGDHRLLLDLTDRAHAELLLDELRRTPAGRTVLLQEALPGAGGGWLLGPRGRHVVELVVPLVRSAPRPDHRDPPAYHPVAARDRVRPPGSEWLYLKLFGPAHGDDDLIAGPLRSFGEFATSAGLCDSWFFLRYADPDHHLRVRFYGDPSTLIGPLMEQVCAWAGDLVGTGERTRFGFDTYEREVERFGGTPGSMAASELVFAADSVAVTALIDLRRAALPLDAVTVAMLSTDDLLASLGFPPGARLSIYRSLVPASRDGGREYRHRQGELRRCLGPSADGCRPPDIDRVFAARRRALDAPARELAELAGSGRLRRPLPDLALSFVHLHLNRLLGADRATETLVVDLLRRTHDGLTTRADHG